MSAYISLQMLAAKHTPCWTVCYVEAHELSTRSRPAHLHDGIQIDRTPGRRRIDVPDLRVLYTAIRRVVVRGVSTPTITSLCVWMMRVLSYVHIFSAAPIDMQ